jgi:hypothetical protein
LKPKAGLTLALLLTSLLFLQICSEEYRSLAGGRSEIVNASPSVLTGNVTVPELTVEGGKRVDVIGSTLILTGNITVKDTSQLVISNSRIQLSIRGEKAYNVSIHDLGSMVMVNSALETLSGASTIGLLGNSSMTLTNSNVTGFNLIFSSGNSTLNIQGGQLNVGYISCGGKAVSITNGYMPKGELHINTEKAQLEQFKGDSVFMTVVSPMLN